MLLLIAVALAREAPWRWITADQGLASEHVNELVVGPDGMIRALTHAGIYRWDGRRAARDDEGLGFEVSRLVYDARGVAWVRDAYDGLWRLDGGAATRVLGPDGAPIAAVDLVPGADGEPVALVADRAVALSPDGARAVGPPLPARARVLRADGAGWFVGTDDAYWRVAADGTATRVASAVLAIDAQRDAAGGWWTVDIRGAVRRIDPDGQVRVLHERTGRGIRLTTRGTDAWVGYDNGVVRVAADGTAEVWDAARGLTSGGPVLFDHEGSLWLGTFRGLGQLPDVGAALYDRRDGLPSEALRDLEVVGERVWASGWGGLAELPAAGGPIGAWQGPVMKGRVCVDAAGGLWGVGTDGLDGPARFVRIAEEVRTWPAPSRTHFRDACAPDEEGGVWITADDGLYRADAAEGPRRARSWDVPELGRVMKALAVAPDGTVWVAGGWTVCAARGEAPWACSRVDGRAPVTDLVVTARGTPWIASPVEGVLAPSGAGWAPLPGAAALASRDVIGLAPSPRGGVWVLGHGVVARVEEAPEDPGGWRVVETLAAWLGHLVSGATDVVELPAGDLWIAHNGGLTHVPAASRFPPREPPDVALLELRVDGRKVADEGAPVALPAPGSGVYLRFVARAWRAPALVRYRVRVGDGGWNELGGQGELELGDLRPGLYAVEVAASLDGESWSAAPLRVDLDVPVPLHRRPIAWVTLGAILALGAAGAERARARVERRIERLRTRVALDLHDEIGAGLGAIGLLAGMLARPGLPPAAAADAAGRVQRIAADLGRAMRGIVWSLRPESTRMDALGRYLGEQARALLPAIDAGGGLVLELPAEPVPLDLDVLRAVQLVALEALHNAARHAHASRVRLALAPAERGWSLVVEDDGVGLGEGLAPAEDAGNGLRSLRQRAEAVGARLSVASVASGGTRVRLDFQPVRSRFGGLP